MGIHWKDGYSSSIDLTLIIDDERLSVAQVGPDYLILKQARDIPDCYANLEIRIDDYLEVHRIALLEGASVANSTISFVRTAQSIDDKISQATKHQMNLPLCDA
jgi:hypothetical protein